MGGPVHSVPERFYHVGRPQYSRFSKKQQPAIDMKKMRGKVDMPDFNRFLEGDTCPRSVFSDFRI
jgi:hypothetical protein